MTLDCKYDPSSSFLLQSSIFSRIQSQEVSTFEPKPWKAHRYPNLSLFSSFLCQTTSLKYVTSTPLMGLLHSIQSLVSISSWEVHISVRNCETVWAPNRSIWPSFQCESSVLHFHVCFHPLAALSESRVISNLFLVLHSTFIPESLLVWTPHQHWFSLQYLGYCVSFDKIIVPFPPVLNDWRLLSRLLSQSSGSHSTEILYTRTFLILIHGYLLEYHTSSRILVSFWRSHCFRLILRWEMVWNLWERPLYDRWIL